MPASFARPVSRLAGLVVAVAVLIPASPAFAISSRTLIAPTGVASDWSGYAVASAGDVNGDGYLDFIVGAPLSDFAGADAGRAYVFFGGPTLDATPDWTLTGAAAGDQFGVSVDGAGDVNGDGFDDVIVGANQNDFLGANAGRAYVYFGGTSPNTAADMLLNGVAAGDGFGNAVAGVGDVNGDGYADVISGAPTNDAGGLDAGRVYVYFGGAVPNSAVDVTLTGAAAGDQFGFELGRAGDVNSDGYGDIIVGAIDNDANGATSGAAYVYLGGLSPDNTADWTLNGLVAGDVFGVAVNTAGDVNGDGYDDILVGASNNDTGGAGAGQAYIFFGGGLANATPDVTFTGPAAGAQFGYSLAPAGDVNGDGFDDVIVGAPTHDFIGDRAGAAYLYLGGASPNSTADLYWVGSAPDDQLGRVGGVGDMNGDGFDDVIVGAPGNDQGGTDAGRFSVLLVYPYEVLSPNGGEQWVAGQPATVRWRGHDPADIALSLDGGATFSTLVNGVGGEDDNSYDITVPFAAAQAAKVRVSQRGAVVTRSVSDASDAVFRIVLPTNPPHAASRVTFTPTGLVGDDLGYSVGGAGDVNGDGYDDVIAGATSNDTGGLNAGQAYVYFGGPGADATSDWTLTGAAAGDQFGFSVAAAGDVNGDGYGDVIVGANLNDAGGVDAGRAYVYFGGPSPDAVADLTLTGAVAGDRFGSNVGGAGDVNGDGDDEVIVGAPLNDAAGVDAGRAYVYFGGLAADAVADLTLTGAVAGDQFGTSVTGIGDMNGDGRDDMIVGAPFNDPIGSNAGRAYIYHGGFTPDATADLILDGRAVQDNLGFSVGSAGDVNGDGYADAMAGAPGNDTGALSIGQAYVFFGGPGADATADWTLTGVAGNDQLGSSVSGAGDVNRDGFDDVIVGAPFNDANAVNAGSAYVYFGGPAPDAVADLVMSGTGASDFFGASVGAADVRNDGFSDLVVCAYLNDTGGADAGRVYLYEANRFFVVTPNDDEVWNVGAGEAITWLGAERADIWLSVNGGITYEQLRHDVGGEATNLLPLLVPHTPTRFARIKVTAANTGLGGADESDSLFTIQSSVALLLLVAQPSETGTLIEWGTEPAVGPAGLAGYRLYRLEPGATGNGTRIGPDLIAETRYVDRDGGPGHTYRLTGVNGLQEELELGRVTLARLVPLVASPMPYRGGQLTVSFGVQSRLGAPQGDAEVTVYDLGGRRVKTLARGTYRAGQQVVTWDGRDDRGRSIANGLYLVQVSSGSERHSLKLVVSR